MGRKRLAGRSDTHRRITLFSVLDIFCVVGLAFNDFLLTPQNSPKFEICLSGRYAGPCLHPGSFLVCSNGR
jgi:hypothetical protein